VNRLPNAQLSKGIIMDKSKRNEIIAKYARKEGDTGSPEVQIALLSGRILELTEHLKTNKKDHSTRRGLLAMVSLRKKLLAYLMRENLAKYVELTDELGIRRAK
jgi:small subunit ribosomal protein S15